MLKLKLQYFGHIMGTADSLEKILMLGKIEDRRRRGWQRMKWLDGTTDSMVMNREMVRDREAWWAAVQGVTKSDRIRRQTNKQTNTGSKVCHIVTFILGWQRSCLFHTLNYVLGVSSPSHSSPIKQKMLHKDAILPFILTAILPLFTSKNEGSRCSVYWLWVERVPAWYRKHNESMILNQKTEQPLQRWHIGKGK